MKRSLLGIVAATAGAAAVVTAFAGPASAVVNYTVTAGGAGTTVAATNVGNLIFEDTFSGPLGTLGNASLKCTGLSASGSVNPGGHAFTTAPPVTDAAGQITPAAGNITGCTNITVGAVTVTPSGTWKLGLATKTATGGTGYLSGVSVHLHAGSGVCDADATGNLKGTYTNSTGNLVLDTTYNGLTLSNVVGTQCATVGIYDGDPAAGSATVHLNPAPVIS